jgi:hypothetical protein
MTHKELIDLLIEKGFTEGWALSGTDLVLWENEQDPPTPLKRFET